MKLKRFIAVGCIVGILGLGVARPRAVYASTSTDIAIGLTGFVVWIAAIFITTKIVYGNQPVTTALEDPLRQYDQPGDPVRFVTHCRQAGGDVTVACW